ncbi:MAG: hypothetical protein GY749_33645 [Desulfobacteraceae bacterium]|nr:hypothetical protein [Desulfobacteraceae bacterium]
MIPAESSTETKICSLKIIDYKGVSTSWGVLNIPPVLVPMLRVGMQGVALRADIPKAKLAWQISVTQLVHTLDYKASFILPEKQFDTFRGVLK